MKALTVRQPWAGLIARGIKDVENRAWAPSEVHISIGERFAVHAGRRDDPERLKRAWMAADVDLEHPMCMVNGLIVCTVRLVDVTRSSTSPWAIDGAWHWVLDQPRRVRDAAPVRGRRGLWELE